MMVLITALPHVNFLIILFIKVLLQHLNSMFKMHKKFGVRFDKYGAGGIWRGKQFAHSFKGYQFSAFNINFYDSGRFKYSDFKSGINFMRLYSHFIQLI